MSDNPSKRMKGYDHEQLYRDGKHYDALNDFITDVPFYLSMAAKYGEPILELACGTGRITIPMKEKGYDIVGIDASKGMLDQAKMKALKANHLIDFKLADVRDFDLKRKFKLILFPFNSICHLHDYEGIVACFKCVKKHLTPDGRFIIDVFKPEFQFLFREDGKRYDHSVYKDPYGGEDIKLEEDNYYDEVKQVNYVNWYYKINGKEVKQKLNMRVFFPQELDNYLVSAGFEIEKKYGSHAKTAFTSSAEKQLIISRLKTKPQGWQED